MRYAICAVPAAPVRKEDNHRSEMVNQLVFGEAMELLEERNEWFRIRSLYDDYEGWITNHLILKGEESIAELNMDHVTDGLINSVQFRDQLYIVPMGSFLPGFKVETSVLFYGEFYGSYRNILQPFEPEELITTAQEWLNAPYLWGGKTLMGVDCSGFVQTVFKMYGIRIKRDAYLQAEQGIEISLSQIKPGDLGFFQNENGRITHVGILIDKDQILHAAGKVRIDKFDESGIINVESGKKSHQFHSIRRFF